MCWHAAIVPRGGSLTSTLDPSEEWDLLAEPYDCMPEELQVAKLMADYHEIQPAWSLSALLGLLPLKIPCGNFDFWLDVAPINYGPQWSIGYYCIEKPRTIKGLTHNENLIECAVQEFEWLSANGYKLKGGADGED